MKFVPGYGDDYEEALRAAMSRENSRIRRHILEVTAAMLTENESDDVRIVDVAKSANVGVPTIYYYFKSRKGLIAEAQVFTFMHLSKSIHSSLDKVSLAVDQGDEPSFWAAMTEHIELAWTTGQSKDRRGMLKLFVDVWSDSETEKAFWMQQDARFDRWVALIDKAKDRGWVRQEVDAISLVTVFWSAAIAQPLFATNQHGHSSVEKTRDLFLYAMKPVDDR